MNSKDDLCEEFQEKVYNKKLLNRLCGIFKVIDAGREIQFENNESELAFYIMCEAGEILKMIEDFKMDNKVKMISVVKAQYQQILMKYQRFKRNILDDFAQAN